MTNLTDRIAATIRRSDGNHTMGVAALADAIAADLGNYAESVRLAEQVRIVQQIRDYSEKLRAEGFSARSMAGHLAGIVDLVADHVNVTPGDVANAAAPAPPESVKVPPVRPGQTWVDNDPRTKREHGVDRYVRVTALDGDFAVCEAWYDRAGAHSRTVRIRIDRFKPTRTGYRFVSNADV